MNYLIDDNKNIENYLDKVYPVGSIYMSTNATSPATLFGGTWKALNEGRVLIGANSTYPVNSTGGETAHTLTMGEMPEHLHSLSDTTASGYTDYAGTHSHTYYGIKKDPDSSGSSGAYYATADNPPAMQTSEDGSHRHSFSVKLQGNTGSTGGSQPHNNMQPYLAVYMWERTA